jgi:hypothetical protein
MKLTEAQIRRTVRGILRESWGPFDSKIFEEDGSAKPHFAAEVEKVAKAIYRLANLIADKASEDDPEISNMVDQLSSGAEAIGDDEAADLRYGLSLRIEELLRSRTAEAKIILKLLSKLGDMSSVKRFVDTDVGLVGDGDPVNIFAPNPTPDEIALILSQSAREFIASMVQTAILLERDEEAAQSAIKEMIYDVFRFPQHSREVQLRGR